MFTEKQIQRILIHLLPKFDQSFFFSQQNGNKQYILYTMAGGLL